MDIRHLKKTDMAQAQEVWRTCFGDTDAFIDAYFDAAADIERGLGIFEGGKLLSDLLSLDFSARLAGQVFPTRFIAGCATLPEARKQDHMRTLIRRALQEMRESGYAMVYLHPFLHAFYRKFGFETVAYVRNFEIGKEKGGVGDGAIIVENLEQFPVALMRRAYDAYTRRFDNCFERSADRFETWLRLLFSDEGKAVYLLSDDGAAYALYYEKRDTADIFEAVYFSEQQCDTLLEAMGKRSCKYFAPAMPGEPEAAEHTMMRVLDPAALLRAYPFGADTPPFVINISDDFLETEYRLGVEVKGGYTTVRATEASADIKVDAGLFAQMVSGAYAQENNEGFHTLFPLKSSCYFETY